VEFESALKRQTQAIQLVNDASAKEVFRSRLKLYRQNKPYREMNR
jgi:hypothetical protein